MLKYLRAILICGFRIIFDYFAWMIKYSRHPERYPLEERYKKVRSLLLFIAKALRVDFKVEGLEKYLNNDKSVLIVSNHLSNFDPLALVCISEKPLSFVAKIETKKFPFIGRIIKAIDGVFLDRNDIRQEIKAIKTVSQRLSENKLSYCIFPEGTRNKQHDIEHMLDFKPGAFKAATMSKSDVVLVSLYGSYRVLEKQYNDKKFPVQISFLDTYTTEQINNVTTVEFAKSSEEQIKNSIAELIKIDTEYMSNLKKR